uniref:non-specific serine/threonine protein kinase n=1 Tax=Caenorhabditis tropicalis TaxID=1561998 RepID=A0A1I7U3J6_9PELO
MKTEIHGTQQRRLSIEKSILKEIDAYSTSHQKTRHFCELIDSGQTHDYSWIVMTLIGPSLDIVRRLLNKQYSKSCVINMAVQILDAVEIMHEVGFIHRDLKPGNICTGNPPNDDHVLYVLDFGISRRIFKNNKSRELRNKRERVPFYGTRKFCNRACHMEQDQGRKDDMETYVYTILDLFHNEKGLPWSKDLTDQKKIIMKKKALFANPHKELDPMIPSSISRIINYLNGLKFQDPIDYRFIEIELKSSRSELKTSDPSDETMDWTGKLEKLLRESKKNKKAETPKGEETLMFERLTLLKKAKEMASSGQLSNEASCAKTLTSKDVDGSEGPPTGFNTTQGTNESRASNMKIEKPPKIEKKKSRSRN